MKKNVTLSGLLTEIQTGLLLNTNES